jgi:NAD(P)-dependent dehydrogenase (short-subunit alcohol dehydrogenase family)
MKMKIENKKVALVTGASSGIGEETTRALLATGYEVYAAARRVDRMTGLEAAGARLLSLDLTLDASIVAAANQVRDEAGRLDVLVNNAGYGSYGAVEDVPMEEARRQFEVNLFGAARLTQLLLPMMRSQKSGKIVNVSSMGGRFGEPFGAWYHATKFALEGFSDSLRMELTPFGLDVIVIQPGGIKTEWGEIAADTLLEASGERAYAPYARRHARLISEGGERLGSPPSVIAKAIRRSVGVRRPRTRYAVGGGARPMLCIKSLLSDRMFDRLLWTMSQRQAA